MSYSYDIKEERQQNRNRECVKSAMASSSANEEDTCDKKTSHNINLHLKCLYGIIVCLFVFVILIFWILNEQISTLKTEHLLLKNKINTVELTPEDYSDIVEKSAILEFENILFYYGDKRHKRNSDSKKRKVSASKVFRNRHKRDDVESRLNQYCMTIYDICDSNPYPGPPAMPLSRGPPGPPGPMGPKGNKGDPGAEGTPGTFGFDGIPGTPGDKGEPGAKGERGLIGFPGDKGDKGSLGEKGVRGSPGYKGKIGPAGPSGVPGPRGPPGPMGLEGLRGQNGRDGTPGEKGSSGRNGAPGNKGLKGDKGGEGIRGPPGYGINCLCEKGAKGDKGQRGLVGFTGYKGDKGEEGDRGQRGDRGYTGIGEPGPIGPPGRKGVKGQKGDCQEWTKEMQNWRSVNLPKGNSNIRDRPQQDYRAHASNNRKHSPGSRDSRSSGTNSVNIATKSMTSCLLWVSLSLSYLAHQL